MLKSKPSLFEDSEGEDGELHINTAYATKYEEWRRGEELQKLKDRYGEDVLDSSDSESSSDGDYVEPDNPEFDRDFLRTLGALHNNKDTQLKGAAFFTGNYRKKKKEEEEKAMTLKDYERHIILDRGGELEEEENRLPMRPSHSDSPQKGNKLTSFDDNLSSDSDSDGDGLLTSGLFKVKEPSCTQKEKATEVVDDAVAFVKGENSVIRDTKDKDLLQGLREAWNDPKMSENDKWLADFFLNKRYLEEEDESVKRAYNEAVIDEETLSEDEKTLQTMETFETKYRFRYEEPDQEFIKKYPRIIPNSVRAKDERRKLKHEAIKERKLKEKELKRQEIQRLKALKYKEIEAKIQRIKEASGNNDIDLGDKDLDEEFDEAAHEQTMSRMFGEDYYAIDDENAEKPVFEDDDDDDYVIQDYDDWVERQGPSVSGTGESCGWEGDEEDHYMDGDEDADYDESRQTLQQEMISHSTKKKARRKSKFAQAIKQKKPVFDPNEKNFQSYFEEYYKLDFEDIVGGIPCRFKYKKVEANSFGLSTEEILTAQDKELNSWYSLKKMFKHDRSTEQEHHDRSKFSKLFFQTRRKQKTFPSLFVEDPEQLHIDEEEKKRLKNLKKKLRRQQKLEGNVEADVRNQPTLGHWDSKSQITEDSKNQSFEYNNEKQMKKKTKKRKREEQDLSNSGEDLPSRNLEDESNINTSNNGTPTDETREKQKRKKKKKSGGQESTTEDNTQNNESDMSKTAKLSYGSTVEKEVTPHDPNAVYDSAAPEDTVINSTPSTGKSKRKKKKKKPKKETQGEHSSGIRLMNKGRKSSTVQQDSSFFQGISDTRLAAYGENPKKLKNKVKYGKKKF